MPNLMNLTQDNIAHAIELADIHQQTGPRVMGGDLQKIASALLYFHTTNTNLSRELEAVKAQRDRMVVENAQLKWALYHNEDYRKAYQKGKYELYAMGGEVLDAASKLLPMSEGPLERYARRLLDGYTPIEPPALAETKGTES